MKKLASIVCGSLLPVLLLPFSALAKGEVIVEDSFGDTEVYSAVTISDTKDILYIEAEDSSSILLITKNECDREGQILVCNKARMGIKTYGVIEEIQLEDIFLFINPTRDRQPIQGSEVTMTANTILLEAVTEKGSFITGLGRIDSNSIPESISR